jgi:methylated-DNA-[protein]-cysteine S-methyltransferase
VRVTRHRYAVEGWGVGEVIVSEGLVLGHELPDPGLAWDGGSGASGSAGTEPSGIYAYLVAESRLVRQIATRVRAHLGGTATVYHDLRLDLSWCTEFQHELALALRAVPWGEVVSYGELAALAGRPGAARAAGTFCAQNRFALMLPCHRVVSSDGIGGYPTAGVAFKRRLLALEGVEL